MVRHLRWLLLPVSGALSAFLSFVLAAPYVKSLDRPWLKPEDPAYHFTYGTTWTYVQHAVFGFLLCGSFCFLLEAGRRSPLKVLQSTVLGALLGAITNSLADSAADLIGMASMRSMGTGGQFFGEIAWVILVPGSLAFTIYIAMGLTAQRVARALYATTVAAVFTFIGRIIGGVIGAIAVFSKINPLEMASKGGLAMEMSIPSWMGAAIAAGIALGLTMYMADRNSRKGSLRLMYGKREFKEWSLDYAANRIGSGEVEIPVRGFKGIEPVHACIFRQGNQFILDCQHFPGLLNGYPVQQAALNHHDTFQIGDATLVFFASGAVQSYHPRVGPGVVNIVPGPGGTQVGVFTPQPAMQPEPAPVPVPVAAAKEYALLDLAGKAYPLSQGENSVGREVGMTVCLAANTTVSRQHASVVIANENATLIDKGSANGTRVNGVSVTGPVALNSGDEISFGTAVMTFRVN